MRLTVCDALDYMYQISIELFVKLKADHRFVQDFCLLWSLPPEVRPSDKEGMDMVLATIRVDVQKAFFLSGLPDGRCPVQAWSATPPARRSDLSTFRMQQRCIVVYLLDVFEINLFDCHPCSMYV